MVLASMPLGVYTLRISIMVFSFFLCATFLLRVFWIPQPTWARTGVAVSVLLASSGLHY
jgi:hypothetical protein